MYMYGRTSREDPEYPGILSIPDTDCVCEGVCMEGQFGRTRSIPGYLVSIPDTVSVSGMNGGTTREDPEYPGSECPEYYVWGDNSGGSRVSRDT